MFTGKTLAAVDDLHSFSIAMQAHQGMSLLIESAQAGARTAD
jgi:hypothetical protein